MALPSSTSVSSSQCDSEHGDALDISKKVAANRGEGSAKTLLAPEHERRRVRTLPLGAIENHVAGVEHGDRSG